MVDGFAFGEPAQHRGAVGEQGEVADVVAEFAKPADGFGEVPGFGDGHRDDQRAGVAAGGEGEHVDGAGAPGGQVLEVAAQGGRQHAVQAEAEVFGVADGGAGQPPGEVVGGLRLPAAERPVDPHQHVGCPPVLVRQPSCRLHPRTGPGRSGHARAGTACGKSKSPSGS